MTTAPVDRVELPAPTGATHPPITRRTLAADGLLAAVTLGILGVPTLLLTVALAQQTGTALALVVTPALAGAILVRRRYPVIALAGLTLLAAAHVALQAWLFPLWFGVLVILYSVGRFSRWPGRLAGFGLAFLASLLAATWFAVATGLVGVDVGFGILDAIALLWIPPMLLFGVAILIGWGVAAAATTEAATEVAQVSLRRADQEEERAALARDMHDVVAHSLAVVIAQANGARYTADPAAKDASLETIAGTAKQALGDVRLLLAQLRHSEAPDPVASLDGLDVLIERMRAAGLDVRLERVGGKQALPRTADIAAYRILQEALTNALRHGDRTQPVHVRLLGAGKLGAGPPGGSGIVLDVHNRLLAAPGEPGHGVRGMHERARIAGGELWAGIDDGWFRVRAAFPAGLQ
ncbi:sensor histidine kinase [Agrococcus beijingensis]|uniref:sensor histidine kinase n=1 Tax=Agrococcus beijingensis TaxID=3068634 RepID=UPI0027416541|nr:histidine kinase [Agrococcus sp. REN33]